MSCIHGLKKEGCLAAYKLDYTQWGTTHLGSPCPQSLPEDRGPSHAVLEPSTWGNSIDCSVVQYVHFPTRLDQWPFSPRRSSAPKRSRPHRLGRLKLLRRAAQASGSRISVVSSIVAPQRPSTLSHHYSSRRMPSPALLAILPHTSPPPLSPTLNSGFIPGTSGQRQQASSQPRDRRLVSTPLVVCCGLTD